MDDQVLDLALMTNYSQSTFMWTVASSSSVFAIRSNIVWVGHPTQLVLVVAVEQIYSWSCPRWITKINRSWSYLLR